MCTELYAAGGMVGEGD